MKEGGGGYVPLSMSGFTDAKSANMLKTAASRQIFLFRKVLTVNLCV